MNDSHFRRPDNERRRKTDIVKAAIKEAVKEWMDDKYKIVGKWTIRCFCTAGFCLFVRLLFHFNIVDFHQFVSNATDFAADQLMGPGAPLRMVK